MSTLYNQEDIIPHPLPRDIKIVVQGAGGVGKSAITVRYVQNVFVANYDPTIEDSYRVAKEFGEKTVNMEILDTAGTEKFTAMRDLYNKNGQGYIFVYSILTESTFNDIPALIDSVVRVKDTDNFPMVIVGNKLDLDPEFPDASADNLADKPKGGSTGTRAVSTEQGHHLAQKNNASFLEVSAKSNYHIDLIFVNLLYQFARVHGKDMVNAQQPKKKKCVVM